MAEAIIFNLQHQDLLMDNDAAGIAFTNAGNPALFEDIFKTHFSGLHAYAYSVVKDAAAAEEIVQNVFYKLWERKNNVKIEQSVAAYLYRAVYNDSLNYLRHNKVKAAHQTYTTRNTEEGNHATDPASLRELQQKIDTSINELPEQCRTIFQMSRFEDLTYRSIADKLGISVKTVENQMGKALRVLRTKLIDYLPVLLFLFINIKNLML